MQGWVDLWNVKGHSRSSAVQPIDRSRRSISEPSAFCSNSVCLYVYVSFPKYSEIISRKSQRFFLLTFVSTSKTGEPIEMPFRGDSRGPKVPWHIRWGSKSDESICSREGRQFGNAAFRRNSSTTCYRCHGNVANSISSESADGGGVGRWRREYWRSRQLYDE